jgi:hypothetical protein
MDPTHALPAADPLPATQDRVAGIEPTARGLHLMQHPDASLEFALGSALVGLVRHVLQDELQARIATSNAPPRSPWVTPPMAARLTRVPVKTIRAWARVGRIPKRLKNRSANPKQQKYLVNVDDVVTVAEQTVDAPAETSDTLELRQRAQERAQHVLAARAAKGR